MQELRKKLNKVQSVASKSILKSLNKNNQALLQMTTGTGKTNTAIRVFEALKEKNKNIRILWLTHLNELVEQAGERFLNVLPGTDVGLFSGKQKDEDSQVTIASVQTISKKHNLEKFKNKFDYIFVDEAHHTPANTWTKTLEAFPKAKKFGFTATPYRPDGRNEEIKEFFGDPVFELLYPDALKKKLIAKTKSWIILTNSILMPDFDSTGDYSRATLDRLWSTSDRDQVIVKSYLKYARPAMKNAKLPFKAICYCINTNHAKNMVKAFKKHGKGVKAGLLIGDAKVLTPAQRQKVYDDFVNKNDVEVLCVVNIFNEGIDIPMVGCLLMARPTKSNIVYTQQVGRGLRRVPGKKEECIVLDFVDNTTKEYLGYTSSNLDPSAGVSHRQIRTDYLDKVDPIVIEERVDDIMSSVMEFENQFRRPDGYWTFERCKKEALKYRTLSKWKIASEGSLSVAYKNGWMEKLTAHMSIKEQNPDKRKSEIIKFCQNNRRRPNINVLSEIKMARNLNNYISVRKDLKLKKIIDKLCGVHSKSVKNLKTGQIYKSGSEAARTVGLTQSNLSAAIRNKRIFGGYHWAYCDENGKVIKNKGKKK